jgi:hypothetical protein
MTVAALQKRVKKNISWVEDKLVLEKINQLIDETSKVYVLSDYQVKRVEESRKQIERGEFYTQEEMDIKVEEWLKEK